MKKLIITSILALTACASGTSFDMDDAKKVKIGTTSEELRELLGPPFQIRTSGNTEQWTWSYANGFTGSIGMVSFPLIDNKVVQLPKFPQ